MALQSPPILRYFIDFSFPQKFSLTFSLLTTFWGFKRLGISSMKEWWRSLKAFRTCFLHWRTSRITEAKWKPSLLLLRVWEWTLSPLYQDSPNSFFQLIASVYLGVPFRDLVYLHDSQPTYLGNGQNIINFSKVRHFDRLNVCEMINAFQLRTVHGMVRQWHFSHLPSLPYPENPKYSKFGFPSPLFIL